jgi:uncharacterized repeat protein (TIGR01451 family)
VAVSQATGTATFDATAGPGNDVDATNDIVRSNDTVAYQVQFNVNDTAAGSSVGHNVTIRQTLPAGLRWARLPATCRTSGVTTVSSISGDGSTIVCNVGDVETGVSRTLALSAQVTETENGTVLRPAAGSITVSADGATGGAATPAPVTVSSIPRVDMVKAAATVTETTRAGVAGYALAYPLRMTIPNRGGRGLIGYAPPAAEMSLVEDFSGVSPNAQLVSVVSTGGGTWTAGAPTGRTVPISIVVADPARTSADNLTTATVTIFVPRSDVVADDPLTARNVITDRVARGEDGTPAVGENLSNNATATTLTATIPAPGPGSFTVAKHYVDVTNGSGRYIPGGSNVDRNGFSTVTPGQLFQGEVVLTSRTPNPPYDEIVACDVLDTTTQAVSPDGPAASPSHGKGAPAWISRNTVTGDTITPGTDVVLEYSTDATSTAEDDATRWAALRATTCDSGTWSATPPADVATITKVRMRFLTDPPADYTLAFAVNLVAKRGTSGETIANFAGYALGAGAWRPSTYDPRNHGGALGDRVILSTARLALTKEILTPASAGTPYVSAGDDVQFRLNPRVVRPSQTIDDEVMTARGVTVTDVLPAGTTLSTLPGHAPSPAPSSVTSNGDGTTTLIWELGEQGSDDTPSITYWATVSRTTSGSKVNRAIVSSPDDSGSLSTVPATSTNPRFASRAISVDALGGIQVDKSVDRQVIEPQGDMTFSVAYANLDLVPREGMDTIDVLPFNGDAVAAGVVPGRNPGSAFHGSYELRAVDVRDGETVRYTDADPAAIYARYDPSAAGQAGYGDLPAGEAWCTSAQIAADAAGCPASVGVSTAIRVTRTAALGAGEARTFSYSLRTSGNRSGDVYANTAALRSSSLALGTLSPTRTVRVVASRIGDLVWNDADEDGLQDPDEAPVAGVRVTLSGTDRYGRGISVDTTTDADGRYLFRSSSQAGQDAAVPDLVSGDYRVTFDPASLPARARFTTPTVDGSTVGEDSDADPATGRSRQIVLPDPSPTGADGEDLTLDAGIVIAAPEPVDPDEPQTPTTPVEAPPVPPTTTVPPTTPEPPAEPGTPATPPATATPGSPRLRVSKVADVRTVRAGGRVTYRVTVVNAGTADARRVRICDVLPDHLSLVSRSARGRLSGGAVCWTVDRLRHGASVTRRVVVRIDRDAPAGSLVNRATAATGSGAAARTVTARRSVRVRPVAGPLRASRVTG